MKLKSYDEWMWEVNSIISRKLGGLTADDLPDTATRDMFDDELDPKEAADEIIERSQN